MIATTDSGICSSTTFLESYLDCVETLPDDMQRNASQLRELDLLYQDRLKEIEKLINLYNREKDASSRRKCLIKIQRQLVKSQEYGDEKLQLVGQMVDMVDNRSRQIEADIENMETFRNDDTPIQVVKQELPCPVMLEDHSKPQEAKKRNRRQRNHDKTERDTINDAGGSVSSMSVSTSEASKPVKKKAKTSRKKTKAQNSPTQDIPIDPNEPTYCLCNQVSFGEMIGCDNDDCPIEWFHFQCVGLSSKPKGKWYCPKCTPERKRNYVR